MVKYIIGTISNMDTPLEPDDLGERSFQAYLLEGQKKNFRSTETRCCPAVRRRSVRWHRMCAVWWMREIIVLSEMKIN